jgi:hypothetical protein
LFFQQLFHPGTEEAPNPLWDMDETTKFCWPRRVHPNASPEETAFMERVWFQIGVVIGLAVYNNQWVALGQPLPPHIFFAMLKREAVAYEDFGVAWPLLDKRLQGLASATPEEWAMMDLSYTVSGDALCIRPGFEAHVRSGTAPLFDMLQTRPAEWNLIPGGVATPVTQDAASLGVYADRYWKHCVGHDWVVNHHTHNSRVSHDSTVHVNASLREMLRGVATLVSAHELDLFATHELVRLFAFRSIQVGGTCASRSHRVRRFAPCANPFPPFTPQVMLLAARAARIPKNVTEC